MKIWKKFMAIILAAAMIVSVSAPAYAGGYNPTDEEVAAIEARTEEIVSELNFSDDSSDYEKAYAITKWLKANVKYDQYTATNGKQGEYHTTFGRAHCMYGPLLDGYGVCDGFSGAFIQLSEAVGLEVYEVSGNMGRSGAHAWNIVNIDGEYYYVDPTNVMTDPKQNERFLFGKNSMIGWYTLFESEENDITDQVKEYNYNYYHSDCNDNHTWKKDANSKESKCTVDGYDIYYCTVSGCHAYYKVGYPATGHHFDPEEGEVTKEPTCSEEGVLTFTCKNCKDRDGLNDTVITEPIEKLPHDIDYDTVVSDYRTCWVNSNYSGKITFKCKNCDATDSHSTREEDYKLNHDFKVLSDTSTCTEAGKITRICVNPGEITLADGTVRTSRYATEYNGEKVCGYTYTEDVPAKGHDLVTEVKKETADCYGARKIYKHCTRCNYIEFEYYDRDGNKLEKDYFDIHTWDDGTVTKEPTCTQPGEKTYTCRYIDDGNHYKEYGEGTKTEQIDALGHEWSEWTVTKEADCTNDGSKTRTCSRCKEVETVVIEKTGHQNTEVSGKTQDYSGDIYCKDCGALVEKGHEITHTWDKGTVTKKATCLETGTKLYRCTDDGCTATREEVIPLAGHTEEIRDKVDATCSTPGYSGDTYCSICGKQLATGSSTEASGHTYKKKDKVEPTCKDKGYILWACTECGAELRDELPVSTKHTPADTVENFKAASCTEEGYSGDLLCTVCGKVLEKGEVTPKTDHDWDEGSVTKNPTCTAAGELTKHCKNCDAETTEQIKANGHKEGELCNVKEATCAEEGYTGDTYCTVCSTQIKTGTAIPKKEHTEEVRDKKDATCTETGYTGDTYCKVCETLLEKGSGIPMLPHSLDEGTVTKEVTCTEDGELTKHCTVCGAETTEAIPAGHKEGELCDVKEATCAEEGYTGDTYCTVCGELVTKGNAIPKKAHTKVVRNKKTATCTAKGYTGDTYCSVCNEKLASGSYTNALGHKYGAWATTKKATAVAAGQQRRICSRCKRAEYRSIARLKATGTLNSTNFPLKVKQSATLKVSGMAYGDYVKSWTSSNTAYATVDKNGRVTGKKRGTATITATLASGKKLTATVKVQTGTVTTTSITVNTRNVTLKPGASYQLVSTRAPFTSAYGISYSTRSSKIATVSRTGKITAKSPGTTYIYVKSGRKSVTIKVKVDPIRTTKLKANATSYTLYRNRSFYWKVTKTPTNSTEGITYSTSNKKIATVNSTGKITGKARGTATIMAKSGSQRVSIKITVK